jgi:phosphoadenosine phosphosulfate reductase
MNLEEQSLKLMKSLFDDRRENIVAFSGGKDSIVLYHLPKLFGLPFSYVYTNTTIDPPGHIGFIRRNFEDVKIIQPRYTFYEVIERYGLPTRHRRFCCQHLKEYVGKGAKVFEGVRIDEGVKRGKRLGALKEPESCDTRVKGKIHAYPIMQWKESDIWNYIREKELIYPSWYDQGFHRLGCVGCPLGPKNQRILEYQMFPRFIPPIIHAIEKNITQGKCLSKFFSDPYSAFHWWISNLSIEIFIQTDNGFFKVDHKKELGKMFNIKFNQNVHY